MFLAFGHLTFIDELLMTSTSGLSDDSKYGMSGVSNIPYVYFDNVFDDA